MAQIKVLIKDNHTLELLSDAKKGDTIDLLELETIDNSFINSLIDKEKNNKINEIVSKEKAAIEKAANLEREAEIGKLKVELNDKFTKEKEELVKEISDLKNTISNNETNKAYELEKQKNLDKEMSNKLLADKDKEINEANNKLNNLISDNEASKKLEEERHNHEIESLKQEYEAKLKEVNNKLDTLNTNAEANKNNALNELKNKMNEERIKEIEKTKEEYTRQISDLEKQKRAAEIEFEALKNHCISLGTKEVGEDLESFCNAEANNLFQYGYDNCTWKKDNESIKDDDESKGTKADYIYRVFVNNTLEQELTSVCLEMKNEAMTSVNKKKNSDHYEKLDKDRKKKNCKYALLVSALEADNENLAPIYKVHGYENMYVVRPQYMTTFLTMITSMTLAMKDIIIAEKNESLDLMAKEEFINKYDELKHTYLDKPLEKLGKDVEEIRKNSKTIFDACNKINDTCNSIVSNYINQIQDKLDKFSKGMVSSYRKLDKNTKED